MTGKKLYWDHVNSAVSFLSYVETLGRTPAVVQMIRAKIRKTMLLTAEENVTQFGEDNARLDLSGVDQKYIDRFNATVIKIRTLADKALAEKDAVEALIKNRRKFAQLVNQLKKQCEYKKTDITG